MLIMNILYMLHPKNSVDFLYDDDSVETGLKKLRDCGFTALPVIDNDGIYIGTVSEGDFMRCILDNSTFSPEAREDYAISDIIRDGWNPPLRVTAPMDELLIQVMDQNFLPITDDRGCFVGIITRKDIIRYFFDKYNQEKVKE